jgi:hypothetical protein
MSDQQPVFSIEKSRGPFSELPNATSSSGERNRVSMPKHTVEGTFEVVLSIPPPDRQKTQFWSKSAQAGASYRTCRKIEPIDS